MVCLRSSSGFRAQQTWFSTLFFSFYSFFIVDKVFTQFTISYYLQLERKSIRNGLYSSVAVITIEMLFHFYYSQEIHFYLCTYLLICLLPSFFLSLLTYLSFIPYIRRWLLNFDWKFLQNNTYEIVHILSGAYFWYYVYL